MPGRGSRRAPLPGRRLPRRLRHAFLRACLLLVAACGGGLRTDPASRYQGILLDARQLGAREVERAAAADPAVRDWLAREGQPDWILKAGPDDLELVYYRASRIVLFHRPAPGAPTQVGVAAPLPSGIRPLLPSNIRAGSGEPEPDPGTSCWTIDVAAGRCRTCCRSPIACGIACTPRGS